ncbi:MAG: MGMT family protein [Verrucomicrobiales bacterium]|jgi:methylated-DNA-[protein]-cysteine S-methyltransferase|nr:MGMT family protein [Verrucomicrobiales bacterium]
MVTPFQQKVYDAIVKIPRGKVTTYKLLAETLRCRSFQAIGQALRRNPFAPAVPCHRIIRTDLTIGGYGGAVSGQKIRRKLNLLRQENVTFSGGKLADPRRIVKIKQPRANK